MRKLLAGLALALVGACGGGDNDITNPPDSSQLHTLTVAGTGTGSGRITSAEGVSPALDCTLAANGAGGTGTCSGDYPEGTSVTLSAAPVAGSTFAGWSGDGASCATAATCTISVTSSMTVTAEFSAAAPAGSVEVASSAWYPDPEFGDEGIVNWMVEVRNNSSQTVEVARVDFVSHDAAGNVLASDFTFVGPIPPGETRANEGFADYHGTEATADIKVVQVQNATEDQGLGVAQVVSSNWQPDPNFGERGAIVWTVEVQNTGTMELESVEIDFTTYDANGNILDYDFILVGPVAPGERSAAEGLAELRGGEANVAFKVAAVSVANNLLRSPD